MLSYPSASNNTPLANGYKMV